MNADINVRERYQQRIINAAKRRDAQQDAERAKIERMKLKDFIENENKKHAYRQRLARQEEREYAKKQREQAREEERRQKAAAREAAQADAAENRYITANSNQIWRKKQAEIARRQREEKRAAERASAAGPWGGGGMGGAMSAFGGIPGVRTGMRAYQYASYMGASPMVAGAVGVATTAAIATALMPQIVGSVMSNIEGAAGQYASFRRSTAAIGRAGNFNSYSLQDKLYMPGVVPPWMKQLGLTPEEAMSALTATGLTPQSGSQGRDLIQSLGEAEMMPFLGGLGLNRYAQSANLAATLGLNSGGGQFAQVGSNQSIANPSGFGMRGYFSELQKVTATAVAAGMDRSAAISNVEGLLRATAGSASGGISLGGGQGQMEWWARMISTGNASMRSGEGVVSTIAAANQAVAGIGLEGGNPLGAVATQRYVNNTLGGRQPQNEDDVKKLIGEDVFNRLSATTDGKRAIARVIAAGQKGNAAFVNEALIPIFTDNPELWNRVGRGSGLGDYSNPFMADLSTKRLFGGTLVQAGITNTTQGNGRIGPYGQVSVLRSMGDVPAEMYPALQAAANQYGVPVEVLAAIAHNESGNTWANGGWKTLRGTSGEYGFMQLMPDTADMMGVPANNRLDPMENAKGGAKYYAQMLQLTGGDPRKAAMLYNWGPGTSKGVNHLQAVMSGVGIPDTVQQYGNRFMANLERRVDPNAPGVAFGMHANAGNATMGQSEQAYNTFGAAAAGSIGDAMLGFSGKVNQATEALSRFIGILNGAGHGSGGVSTGSAGPRISAPAALPNRVILPAPPGVGAPARP
jgi:hypothetical protein